MQKLDFVEIAQTIYAYNFSLLNLGMSYIFGKGTTEPWS